MVTLNSCGFCNVFSKQYYFTSEGGVRPGKNRFYNRKDPYILKEADLIKSNGVYQCYYIWDDIELKPLEVDKDHPGASIKFLRFFDNGRFIMNDIDTTRNHLIQYNNLKSATVGYYKIEDTKLIVEYFDANLSGMASDCGKYYSDTYEITENGIQLISERRSSNGIFYGWNVVSNSILYHKFKILDLTGIPNW